MKRIKKMIFYLKDGTLFKKIKRKFLDEKFIKDKNALVKEYEKRTLLNLEKRYAKFIEKYEVEDEKSKEASDFVWICWFQGMNNAPKLVKACYNSIKENMSNKQIVVLTLENIKKYVDIPAYIYQKFEEKVFSYTHFSDILRAAVLCKYGGIWIDSTVLCTSSNILKLTNEYPLFVFKSLDLDRKDEQSIVASSWFISAKYPKNKILMLTRDLLYEYWKKSYTLDDYFLFHLFFTIATKKYKDEWNEVPTFNNHTPHILMFELNDKYTLERWKQIKEMSPIHKLQRHNAFEEYKDNFYNFILNIYLEK